MSRITNCPHCSERLNVPEGIVEKTLICPHCRTNVDNPWPGIQIRTADINTDVKRGSKVGTIVLAVLIGLCILGITLAYFATREGERGIGRAFNLMFLFIVLDVLVGIAIVHGLIRWRISGVRSPSARRALGVALLALGTIFAAIIFFFFTCLILVG